MSWFVFNAEGVAILRLHVQPGAKRSEVLGLHGEALKLRLAAPPVDGKANLALCKFLAETLGVPRSAVTLISGETSRQKSCAVEGVDEAKLRGLLGG